MGRFFIEDLVKIWTKFLLEMRMLRELSFRLSVLCCAERKIQLHGFADSSGAVIYVKVMVVMGKLQFMDSKKSSYTYERLFDSTIGPFKLFLLVRVNGYG